MMKIQHRSYLLTDSILPIFVYEIVKNEVVLLWNYLPLKNLSKI